MIDPVSIVAAIAAIVSAYKDGGHMIKKWLQNRREKSALKLKGLLETTPGAIQSIYNDGRSRFGIVFATGDGEAHSALTRVLIHMNENLIGFLKMTLSSRSPPRQLDCSSMCDTTVDTRHRVGDVIGQYIQRLLVRAPIRSVVINRAVGNRARVTTAVSSRRRRSLSDVLPATSYAPEPQDCYSVHDDKSSQSSRSSTIGASSKSRAITYESTNTLAELRSNLDKVNGSSAAVHLPGLNTSGPRVEELASRLTLSTSPTIQDLRDEAPSTNASDRVLQANYAASQTAPSIVSSRQSSGAASSRGIPCHMNNATRPFSSRYEADVRRDSGMSMISSSSQQANASTTCSRQQIDAWLESSSAAATNIEGSVTGMGSPVHECFNLTGQTTMQPVHSMNPSNASKRKPFRSSMTYELGDTSVSSAFPIRLSEAKATAVEPAYPSQSDHRPLCGVAVQLRLCIAAVQLQRDGRPLTHVPSFGALQSGGFACTACEAQIPKDGFVVRTLASLGGKSRKWQVTPRFLAKCHILRIAKAPLTMSCAMCTEEDQFIRGRNDLWEHLESHSAEAFELEVDILEVI